MISELLRREPKEKLKSPTCKETNDNSKNDDNESDEVEDNDKDEHTEISLKDGWLLLNLLFFL